MNLCKLLGHNRIVRDFYPNNPVTSTACLRCGKVLSARKIQTILVKNRCCLQIN